MKRLVLLFIVALGLSGCSWQLVDQGVKIGSLGLKPLQRDQAYGIVFPIERQRSEPVTLKSIDIVTRDRDEVEGIEYAFYGATPVQSVGIAPWERYGKTTPIDGFVLRGERHLLLYVKLVDDVAQDPLRRLRVTYELNGETVVQVHKVTMIENLHTSSAR